MGNTGSSTRRSNGSLEGAYTTPTIPDSAIPKPPAGRRYEITVPHDKYGGQYFIVSVAGIDTKVKVPPGKKPGDKFIYRPRGDIRKVYASTLPTLPGMEIVQSKPIIWGSVSHTFCAGAHSGQQVMGSVVGKLLQDAQSEILQKAIDVGCNAVLGLSFNVTNDSSGEHGHYKVVIVTACGTPCSVVASATAQMTAISTMQTTTTTDVASADVISVEALYG